MDITYAKLKDNWGLRGEATLLAPGVTVMVKKKDGTTKTEVVGQVVWTSNGVALATITKTGNGNGHTHKSGDCSCTMSCCRPRCRCDRTCNCRGGNIYDC